MQHYSLIEFFHFFLAQRNQYISNTPGRRVAFLLDNASAEGCTEYLPILLSFEVIFLPKNTAAFVQSLDADLVAS